MIRNILIYICVLLPVTLMAKTMSPSGASVYIIHPADGAKVKSPVHIQFGLKKMSVAPAGVQKANTGHHHLIIDSKVSNYNIPIKSDAHHRHFGGGQTETDLVLKPGKHTLQLVLGDYSHIPHKPVVKSKVITITVVD